MKINDVEFTVELRDVLDELQTELHANGIPLINKIKDANTDIMITCPYHKDGQERQYRYQRRAKEGHCGFFTNANHRCAAVDASLEVYVDAVDDYYGIVYQHSHRQYESTERHPLQCAVQHAEHRK